MPIYEYQCDSCGFRFERMQSVQDAPVRQCPNCAGTVHKVLFPAGIIFKGSGWYITDSRNTSSGTVKGNGKSAKSSETPADTQTESKTETKPAAQAEAKTTSA